MHSKLSKLFEYFDICILIKIIIHNYLINAKLIFKYTTYFECKFILFSFSFDESQPLPIIFIFHIKGFKFILFLGK